MSEHSHNNPMIGKTGASPARKLSCEEWETLLVDFLDGMLPGSEAHSFDGHRESCAACAEMFAQAQQGREWLGFLRAEPQAPASLLTNILAQTSGAESRAGLTRDLVPASALVIPAAPVLPFWKRGGLDLAGHQMSQSRLLMTAAMAFFSITLTLNMAGVRLSAVRLADLKPAALTNNLDKQFHMASARVIRYYDNARFFYEMEAQVKELRRNADLDSGAPADKPDETSPSTPQNGDHKSGGKSQAPNGPSSSEQPHALLWGEKVEAGLRNPGGEFKTIPSNPPDKEWLYSESNIEITDGRAADQAERGIA